MTTRWIGITAAVLIIQTALLLSVGGAMWSEAPTPADEAVGKGLVALASALAVPAFIACCVFLEAWEPAVRVRQEPQGRSDWEST